MERGRCGQDSLSGGAVRAGLSTAVVGLAGSFVSVPELNCFVNELAVFAQGTDDEIIAQ
jgi:hypothetical protein